MARDVSRLTLSHLQCVPSPCVVRPASRVEARLLHLQNTKAQLSILVDQNISTAITTWVAKISINGFTFHAEFYYWNFDRLIHWPGICGCNYEFKNTEGLSGDKSMVNRVMAWFHKNTEGLSGDKSMVNRVMAWFH